MTSPISQVLSNPYLLEGILLQLHLRDLLVTAQCIDKSINSFIATSPSVQRALFFLAAADSGKGNSQTPESHVQNPLLIESFPIWYTNKDLTPKHAEKGKYVDFTMLDWNHSEEKAAAYARLEASWRRMLVCQPPIKDIFIVKGCYIMGPTEETGWIHPKDGLRMGTLYDIVESYIVEKSPVCFFAIQWHILSSSPDWLQEPNYPELSKSWFRSQIVPEMTIFLNYNPKLSVGKIGKGYGPIQPRKGRTSHRSISPPPTDPWIFRSHGYQSVDIKFERTSMEILLWRLRHRSL